MLTPPPPPQELAANTQYGEHCAKLNTTLNDVKAHYLKEKSTYEATLAAEKLRFLNMRKHWAEHFDRMKAGNEALAEQVEALTTDRTAILDTLKRGVEQFEVIVDAAYELGGESLLQITAKDLARFTAECKSAVTGLCEWTLSSSKLSPRLHDGVLTPVKIDPNALGFCKPVLTPTLKAKVANHDQLRKERDGRRALEEQLALRRELESPLESYLEHFEEGALGDILAGPGDLRYVHTYWSRPRVQFSLPPSLLERPLQVVYGTPVNPHNSPVESDDEY